jgi:hypothetical protein
MAVGRLQHYYVGTSSILSSGGKGGFHKHYEGRGTRFMSVHLY